MPMAFNVCMSTGYGCVLFLRLFSVIEIQKGERENSNTFCQAYLWQYNLGVLYVLAIVRTIGKTETMKLTVKKYLCRKC